MTEFFYEPLSHLDASFLALETRTAHMHVAAVALFESNGLVTGDGGIDVERIKAHIASKLQYIPRYRQRLAHVPHNGAPVWIDDDRFDFDYHVRHTSLPRPGSDEQLKTLAGRVVGQPLDRSKPLWELWIAEGLDGGRFAIIAKLHHCMIDGIAGVDLTSVLLNTEPVEDVEATPGWRPRPAPTPVELSVAEMARTARKTLDSVTSARDMLRSGRDAMGANAIRMQAAANSLRSGWLTAADRTPLNGEIGPNRRFDWADVPLERIKVLKNAAGATVNGVVLAIVAGAVRTFLHDARGFPTDDIEFRAMAPVSVRKPSQRGTLGNQVAMWLVSLPVSEPDPLRRLDLITQETERLKAENQALGAATLVDLSKGTPIPLISLANRVASNSIRPFNMTVTNVPGPQFPMYMLEARMLANYPIVPLWAQHGLGVALFSYDGSLLWGVHADYDTVPDTDAFVRAIHASIDSLEDALGAA